MKRLINYFVRGCIVLAPIALTIFVIVKLVSMVDQWLGFTMPGAGLAVAVLIITATGYFTTRVIGQQLVEIVERILSRVPLAKIIYTSIRDLIGAFVGDKKGFDKPVLVSISPDGSLRVPGFVTRASLDFLGAPQLVSVYLPQAYNVAGNVLLVPADRIQPVAIERSEFMTFIVSGGVAGAHAKTSVPPNTRR